VSALVLREAQAADASTIAALHAASWRRHYRGAYSDAFLDGDVLADREAVWHERLAAPDPGRLTILAEERGAIGFVNAYFACDPALGTLVDNLHVVRDCHRRGIGTRLMAAVAEAVRARHAGEGIHLWVLEQNRRAQAFYEAIGGTAVETAPVGPPGGVPGRLVGTPMKLRYVWPPAT
jgi:ribosomal protein S18 acetylase RimI-like enzyme